MDPLGSPLVTAIIDECGPITRVIIDSKKNVKSIYFIEYGCDQDCQCHLKEGMGYGDGKGSAGNGLGEGKSTGYEIKFYEVD